MARDKLDEELDLEENEGDEEELEEAPPMTLLDEIQEQFGAAPWWVISATVHIAILLITMLIVVAYNDIKTDDVIVTTDMVKQPERPFNENQTRDIFKNNKNVDIDMEMVENPVFAHEEYEITDHMETENEDDQRTARGQEDAISDIPLGGTGVVGNIGVGGGGAGCFGTRTGGGRKRACLRGGGSPGSESAVDAALRWLAKHQEPDGHWDGAKYEGSQTDPGITGLACLAFLGAGHTETAGKWKKNVQRGIGWIRKVQGADGHIGTQFPKGKGYHHAIAGLALAEAYGMAKQGGTKIAAQKALDFSINVHQKEYSGWRYDPKMDADLSVTGWFVMQMKSGKIAGLKVDGKGFAGAQKFLDEVTDTSGTYPGRCKYKPERTTTTTTMTSVGMLCRQFMGTPNNDPMLIGGANHLMSDLPSWRNNSEVNFYYWYYGTLVMFQMGGDHWKAWNNSLRDMLIDHQRRGGDEDGSWDPVGFWCAQGGRVYSTAVGALCLEVYYRYLPMYRD